MLDSLRIRNFKRFEDVEIELGSPVVFVGPNNSGKTSALQAIALWDLGLRRWKEKRGATGRQSTPKERPGVTLNRRDLVSAPVPDANLLWRDLHVRDVRRTNGSSETRNVRIDILASGTAEAASWECGLEFDYANAESLYCRPLRLTDGPAPERMPVPDVDAGRVAYLPPMSGLADREFMMQPGQVRFLIGQGRTADVVRNLSYSLSTDEVDRDAWPTVKREIDRLFGVRLDDPSLIAERSELVLTYRERGIRLDISSAGRGLQQTLLLLTYLAGNRNSILLLDEPDAHLEFLRQRQTYRLLTDFARSLGSQIIAASHSEVVLNEAADRDVVVAFVGRPHRIDDRGSQVLKSLKEIGFEHYVQAEECGWVLYLEGATDLAILQQFAARLSHPASAALERPFVHYVADQPGKARDHFFGLREALPDLRGFALFDRLELRHAPGSQLAERAWRRREIENYVCTRETLLAWAAEEARLQGNDGLFVHHWVSAMEDAIAEADRAVRFRREDASPWDPDVKASEDVLEPVFRKFYASLNLRNAMNKSDFHRLTPFVPEDEIDEEVREALDALYRVYVGAKPVV